MSGASWICRMIWSWSQNSFKTFENIRKDSKARTFGAVRVEAERRRTMSCHVWTAALTTEKNVFLYIVSSTAMKTGYPTITINVENRGVSPAMRQHRWENQIHIVPLCIWWDQLGVVYDEKLKPTETITVYYYDYTWGVWAVHWRKKRPLYEQRHGNVILQHDNARPIVAKRVKIHLETLKWEVLPEPPYSSDNDPSNYHLFWSMA